MRWLTVLWLWLLAGLVCCHLIRYRTAIRWARLRPISGGQEFEFGGLFGSTDLPGEGSVAGSFTPPTPEPGMFSRFASSLGEGVGKFGKEVMDSPLKSLTSALGLGATGFGIANQFGAQKQLGRQTQMIERGQKRAESAAAPAVEFGRTTLDAASKGNLTPAMQAQIDQWVSQAKADARSRLAAMGLGNSTALNQMDALIDQHAMAMKGQMLAQQEETGLQGLQTGVSAGTGVMGIAQGQQAQLASLIEEANKALGQIGGRAA